MSAYRAAWMTEEHDLLRDAVRKFYQAELAPNEARWAKEGIVDREVWRKAGAAGILCASVPQAYGGAGGDYFHEAIILYEQYRQTGYSALGNMVHSQITSGYILNYGSEDQKMRWLPKMASGEFVAAIAMTEPGTGSDLQGIRTTAVKDGDHYRIDGSKTFITNGQHADIVVLAAKTDPSQGAGGVSLIVVETAELEGFRRGRNLEKLGMKGQDTSELFFDGAHVPVGNLLGEKEGQGFYQLMQQLSWERLVLAIIGVAVIDKALEETIGYTRERKAFGQTIFDFQNTRFKLAEMKTVAEIARVFVDNCLERISRGELDPATASMAKWWVSQMQCDIVDECLQLHGGYGYMSEYPIATMYADSRVQKIYGGTNEIMKELIARSL